MEDFPSDGNLSNKSMQPIAIVSQLLQLVASMHHIDELFMWLATILLERFSMISVQIWAAQAYYTGGMHRKLRVSVSRRSSQVVPMFESAEVRAFVERMLHERRGVLSIPVSSIFSHYQSAIFAQEDCFYWTTYFLSKDVLLPPSQKQSEKEEISTPLQVIFSFFTQGPLQPSQARAVSFLIEQSVRIAIGRGLLSHEPEKPVDGDKTKFGHLIPEHIQMGKIEQGDNPFTHAVVISEKRSRQIYNLIDGKKNIQELTLLMQIDQKEYLEILQILLLNGYIAIREISGDIVEVSTFSQQVKAEFK